MRRVTPQPVPTDYRAPAPPVPIVSGWSCVDMGGGSFTVSCTVVCPRWRGFALGPYPDPKLVVDYYDNAGYVSSAYFNCESCAPSIAGRADGHSVQINVHYVGPLGTGGFSWLNYNAFCAGTVSGS